MNNQYVFDKIDNITWNHQSAALKEFIENVLYTFPVMLAQLSHIYVLVTMSPDNLSSYQEEMLHKNGSYVVGYIWIHETHHDGMYFIKYIDTRVRRHSLAKYMIQQFERIHNKYRLFPHTIVDEAKVYWKRYFWSVYGIGSKAELCKMRDNLKQYDVQWDKLVDILS